MGFFDLFAPKWKHSDAGVRLEAVRQLDVDDRARLERIARLDSDARVRKVAVKKIDDVALLLDLSRSDSDETLRQLARERLSDFLLHEALSEDLSSALSAVERIDNAETSAQVSQRMLTKVAISSPLAEIRLAALGLIGEARALGEVARTAKQPDLRLLAVERLADKKILRDLAIKEGTREVALQAAKRFSDDETLAELEQKASTKAVQKWARQELQTRRQKNGGEPAVSSAAVRRARQIQLCRQVESAFGKPDLPAAAIEVQAAEKEWEALGEALAEDATRFSAAVSRFEKHYRQWALKVRQRMQAQLVEAAPIAENAVAVEAPAIVEDSEARLAEIAAQVAKAEEQARREKEAEARREAERLEREAEEATTAQAIEELCSTLEGLAETKNIQAAEAALDDARAAAAHAGPVPRHRQADLHKRFSSAREKLVARLRELHTEEDWKRWANVPQFEALCVRAEALANEPDLEAVAKALRPLHTEWKAAGPLPREKREALWNRFKAATDAANERCRELFDKLDQERAENLTKKEALCAEVEAIEPPFDFKQQAEHIKAMQEEWKKIGPVQRAESEKIWQRFRKACDRFFDARKEYFAELDAERGDNLKRKEEICSEAEALAQSTDFRSAANMLKKYQQEWKRIGPVPKEVSDALWLRFRTACDQFFGRQKEHFGELDKGRDVNLQKKVALCERVEALAASDNRDAALTQLKKIRVEWRTVGPAPEADGETVWRRFRQACDRLVKGDEAEVVDPQAVAEANRAAAEFSNRIALGSVAALLSDSASAEVLAEQKADEPK